MKDRRDLAISLRLNGRAMVVVGEGPIAERYRDMLKRTGASLVNEGSKAQFAIVVDDPGAVSRLKVRGTLVYAVDRPDLCDFTLIEPDTSVKIKAAPQVRVKVEKPSAERRPDFWRPALLKISQTVTTRALGMSKALAPFAKSLGNGMRAMFLPVLAIIDIFASRLQTRRERANQRPVALNLALAHGGPLDDLAGERALGPAEPTARIDQG